MNASVRNFRFGVNLTASADREEWAAKCREAERLGFDVIMVPDHLGFPAPFPSLIAAAEVTERPRVGTFVLNAGFWNPVLLAREVATVDRLTEGRLELGLGTGYVRAEFDRAGLPWESPKARVDRLESMVEQLGSLLDPEDGEDRPELPRQRPVPLLLGGHGKRMLGLAGKHADIVAFTGATLRTGSGAEGDTLHLVNAGALDERVAEYARLAGPRDARIERNLLIQQVLATGDRRGEVERLHREHDVDHLSVEEMLEVPTLLVGTARQQAEQLRANRERYGFSYLCVLEDSMRAMAPVIEELSGS